MSVKVHISSLFSHFTDNQRVAEVNGGTIGECLKHLEAQFPKLKLFHEDGKLLSHLSIYVNKEPTYSRSLGGGDPRKLDTPIKNGDEVSIIVMIGGG